MYKNNLKRAISLPFLTFYGIGTILGAGIYVLIGKVAGEAGLFTPFAFLLASVVAGFSGLSYCELSSRYPFSAGESRYAHEAFHIRWFSILIGWLIVITGVVSAATLGKGIVGYAQVIIDIPEPFILTSLFIILAAIAIIGIKESVGFITIITIIEMLGLFWVLYETRQGLQNFPQEWANLMPTANMHAWLGIFMGGYIAFYAFIGFEDIVNIAEEVKEPSRNLPIAIITALCVTTVIYILVAVAAVLSMEPQLLAKSNAPLAALLSNQGIASTYGISLISIIAIVNGAFAQVIMSSRVIYGMSAQGMGPKIFAKVNSKTKTPILATLFVAMITILLAVSFQLVTLAKVTSFIILFVFLIVNLSLLRIKKQHGVAENCVCYPKWIPVIGALLCILLMMVQILTVMQFI